MANTHTGQPPSRHVMLIQIGTGTPNISHLVRTGPDGYGVGGGLFRVPQGQFLIVTDVDWSYFGGSGGEAATLRLYLRPFSDPGEDGTSVFESTIISNNAGEGGRNVSMTTGLVVSSNGYIWPEMDSSGGGGFSVKIRGYLCDET